MAKDIVILSDGTGNAASSTTPTNVWRLYQALDLSNPTQQVAFYDDGVGTERWKPLKALGGAFGFGLKRNVIEMYKFLSRTYEPGRDGAPGDRVFVLGFSRGAYTVRVLVGLVHRVGLVPKAQATDAAALDQLAHDNYREFRKHFHRGPRRLWAWITNRCRTQRPVPTRPADDTRITFVGVWDTVDAYGLPIDEMASAWDYFIYPYRFTDRILSSTVTKASHAVALDDERHTFHPVLWDESHEAPPAPGAEPRITQVWFAGMHANVGGGYPDDGLAHVPLAWMLSQIDKVPGGGLRYLPDARKRLEDRADVHGKLYDSRSGLQAYYRYKPRNVAVLCNDPETGVNAAVRIHASVLERIGAHTVDYAPLGPPATYQVVATPPPPASAGTASSPVPQETPAGRAARMAEMAKVWDWVHQRRWLYVMLILATFVLVLSPVLSPGSDGGACVGSGWPCSAASLLQLVSPLLPDWSLPWQYALGQHPAVFWPLLGVFAALAWRSRVLRGRIRARATAAWQLAFIAAAAPAATARRTLTQRVRTGFTGTWVTSRNAVLALVALAAMLFAGLVLANKVLYGAGAAFGYTCAGSPATPTTAADGSKTVTLNVADPCLATGIPLVAGRRYRIDVAARPGPSGASTNPDHAPPICQEKDGYPWRDGHIPAGPEGLAPAAFAGGDFPKGCQAVGRSTKLVMRTMVVARREWSAGWFVLLGQIGANSLKPFEIGEGLRWFRAPASGELFVYVNDAVFGVPYLWDAPYTWSGGANRGTAEITVTPVGRRR